MSPEFYWIAFAVVLVVSAARITRLLTVDHFPPVEAVRLWLQDWMEGSPRKIKWQPLTFCGWCLSFWVVLPLFAWAYFSGVLEGEGQYGVWGGLWWVVNGVMALTYAAGWTMAHDGDRDED